MNKHAAEASFAESNGTWEESDKKRNNHCIYICIGRNDVFFTLLIGCLFRFAIQHHRAIYIQC